MKSKIIWFSVEESYPPFDTSVLMYDNAAINPYGTAILVGEWDGKYWRENSQEGLQWFPSHWAYLPEGPEEDKNELPKM